MGEPHAWLEQHKRNFKPTIAPHLTSLLATLLDMMQSGVLFETVQPKMSAEGTSKAGNITK